MCAGGKLPGIDLIKKIDPLRGGDVILDKFGLPNLLGDKNGILNEQADSANTTVTGPAETTNVAGDVQAARDSEKRRRAAAAGMSSTILGGGGSASTSTKTLLGQ